MKFRIKLILFLTVLSFSVPLLTSPALASPGGWSVNSENPATFKDLEYVLGQIIRAFTGLVGFAFVAMLVIGGFKYMTAGDDPKAAQAAQKTLTMAIIGLVVFFSALVITTAIEALTGMNLSVFTISPP